MGLTPGTVVSGFVKRRVEGRASEKCGEYIAAGHPLLNAGATRDVMLRAWKRRGRIAQRALNPLTCVGGRTPCRRSQVPHPSALVATAWAPEIQSLARVIFGFLLFRHGMEQVFGFPPALTDYPAMSFGGGLKLLAFPGGILLMLGWFTRPVCLALSLLYLAYWFIEPLPIGLRPGGDLFGARGPSDPILLPGFFLMYLAATGPGSWSLDRLLHREGDLTPDAKWATYALGALRIVTAFLLIHHGIAKVYGPFAADVGSLRWMGTFLELIGGPMLLVGLFTRPLSFLLSGQMAVAYFVSHAPNGFWDSFRTPNQEASILNCFLFLLLWATGPGAWSLDGWRSRQTRRLPTASAPTAS